MKATMAILIGNDTRKLREINQQYMSQMKILTNKNEEEAYNASKTKYMRFLDKDYKEDLKN